MSTSRPLFRSELENLINFYNNNKGTIRRTFESSNPQVTNLIKALKNIDAKNAADVLSNADLDKLKVITENYKPASHRFTSPRLGEKIIGHLKDIVENGTIYLLHDKQLTSLDKLQNDAADNGVSPDTIKQLDHLKEQCDQFKIKLEQQIPNDAYRVISQQEAKAELILLRVLKEFRLLLANHKNDRIDIQLKKVQQEKELKNINITEIEMKQLVEFGVYTADEAKKIHRESTYCVVNLEDLIKKLGDNLDSKKRTSTWNHNDKEWLEQNYPILQTNKLSEKIDYALTNLSESLSYTTCDYKFSTF